jgi:hypothetical protein
VTIATWWVDLWNPIVPPKADLLEEARKKWEAGEISLAEYVELQGKAASYKSEIADLRAEAETTTALGPAVAEGVKEGLGSLTDVALTPAKTALQQLGLWIVVGAVLYLLILRERHG